MSSGTGFAAIRWRGKEVGIEYVRIAPERTDAPLVVFLHEGLGSVAMWKDFPERLCEAGGLRGLVFSRPGYGRSTPRAADEVWDVDFMHRQAHEVLPAFFGAIGLAEKPWLFGHSDGASIALLYAARFPERVAGLVVLAPHIFVEDMTVANIEEARKAYVSTDLPQKLGRYHDDVDSAFWGWNRIWLHPPFRQWNIEAELGTIRCPVLAMQGMDDEYGTLAQIRGIAARVPQTELLEIPNCGHSPHRDQPEQAIVAAISFINTRRLP
ncbi:2-hydroxy-6-oxononadienedioate/2-hydroxy-6-oxononatrienedioate hydrolase [Variovorax sp. SRS16]|uniref:alpha/beta fold hydrolase n=1 Tax=Variovorax sp. SRS16 TaxID=282217 RepID=UPI00131874E9|nr:alpha/beta hydrolase [Variovorax sp. SRS16]VTU12822.1 2-hydroxy-6-oxononadienedioate/2-hydroxy-6-oxononatrienedioate hydrolase [Variovorax sp. SRS16]